jgi:very-short-patch-repair endonuclease
MEDIEIAVGRRRGKAWTRVGYGLHRTGGPAPGGPPWGEADLLAWQQVLPPSACFGHLTGASVHGLWLPPVPRGLPVLVSMSREEERPRREGLRVCRHPAPVPSTTVRGLRVATVPEVLLGCARDLGLLDLVVLLDSALHLGLCTREDVEAAATRRRRGAPALRRALPFADARAESPWESVLRVFHVLCDVDVEPQKQVFDERGVFVARGDLALVGTRVLHEYDGEVHRDRRTHRRDLARDRALVNAGWVRRGYTAADLLSRALVVLREIDAEIGRPHDPRRLDRWQEWLGWSTLSSAGRRRVASRLGAT